MSKQPSAGEMLAGAYLKIRNGCDFIDYNRHGKLAGDPVEVDVIGLDYREKPEIYVCEVVTHARGMRYNRGEKNSTTLERKFKKAYRLLTSEFEQVETYNYQLWSPKVRPSSVDDLRDMAADFERETDEELDLIINDRYKEKIVELQKEADTDKSQGNELAFRFLQILQIVE